ncbi:MAG: KH domain-containing protein [bacterium]|nr:KH domain-containing protein [bacterium]
MATEHDKEFVEYVIKSLVNNPDKVEVKREVDEMGVLITVKVDPSDMGLLIGRAGSTAKAIRTLARIVGLRNNARVNLRIVEPEGSTRGVAPRGPVTRDVDDVVGELGV